MLKPSGSIQAGLCRSVDLCILSLLVFERESQAGTGLELAIPGWP